MKWHTSTRKARRTSVALLSTSLALALATGAVAGPREQAKRMHDRLVGVPPATAVLDSMASKIAAGDALGAATEAMQNSTFYTSALKEFVTPWTNEAQTPFAELNDYTTTVIGMIRDDVPFNQVLSADILYVGAPGVVTATYSFTDNEHYKQLEANNINLADPTKVIRTTQSALPGTNLTSNDVAGVTTTRASGEAFFKGGTNRRVWRYTAINHLCRDMEQLSDVSRPADRIRQDVPRSPGGDSSIFLNNCIGCHSGMDAVAGAFAFYEWDETDPAAEKLIFTPGKVQPKYHINSNEFPGGYFTIDDSWINYWRSGPNAALAWRASAGKGNGPKSLGEEVASSRAFSLCQVQKTFQRLCFRAPNTTADQSAIDRIATVFESNNYSMKRVFAETAVYCMGQ